jgi:hypothetical protein
MGLLLAAAGTGAHSTGMRGTQYEGSATLKSATGTLENVTSKIELRGYVVCARPTLVIRLRVRVSRKKSYMDPEQCVPHV